MIETPETTALLHRAGWIHALANSLVADSHAAEDLAQDTLVEALQRRPDGRPVAGWMATVLRNKFSKLLRGDANRLYREENASRSEAQPSALDVLERAATHRDVVEAVLDLEEPYRETILLRYFEGLSHREIARRARVARPTVNSRITRGLEKLRQRLETRYGGDRHAFLLALTPLARVPQGAAALPFGVNLMHLVIASATVSLLVVAWQVSGGHPQPARTASSPLEGALGAAPAAQQEPVLASQTPLPRASVQAAPIGETLPAPQDPASPGRQADYDWETVLERSVPLAAGMQRLILNTRAGDLEVVRSTSGRIEISAHVKADTDRVRSEQLSEAFEDHVKIESEGSSLRIEEAHERGQGLSVSLRIGLPQELDLLANSGAGSVTLSYVGAKVNANSGAGSVVVQAPGAVVKDVNLNSGAGAVMFDIAGVEGSFVANSGAGSVSGRLRHWDSEGQLNLNTGAGSVLLEVPSNISGFFKLESGLGNVEFPDALGLEVRGKGGSEWMKASGQVGSGTGEFLLNTGVGKAELRFSGSNAEPL